jgi:hypothetical protein
VTVHEKEDRVGGLGIRNPAVHMTPMHFQNITDYIGFDVEPCFSELTNFKAYIYSKIVHFNPHHLYVTKRGSYPGSLDQFLYTMAVDDGVGFEFSQPLTPELLRSVPQNSIIATGSYSSLFTALNIPHTPFIHFDGYMEIPDCGSFCLAYFEPYLAGYGYGYIAAKAGVASVELDFRLTQPYETYVEKFKQRLKKTEDLEFTTGSLITDNIPGGVHLLRKVHGNTYVLAGAIGGFHDPFFGFGVNSALISGKIAATTVMSRKKGLQEFRRFSRDLQRMFLLARLYNFLPFKPLLIPRLFTSSKSVIPIIGKNVQSIPGFTHPDCFQILRVER